MLYFDHGRRSATRPDSLTSSALRPVQSEIERYLNLSDIERRQTDVPQVIAYEFRGDVVAQLGELSYGKCPFCERLHQPLSPYRFRPPAFAEPSRRPEDKWSYLWLAFE